MSEVITEQRLTKLETKMDHIDKNMTELISASKAQTESNTRLSLALESLTKEMSQSRQDHKEHRGDTVEKIEEIEQKIYSIREEIRPLLGAFTEFISIKKMFWISIITLLGTSAWQAIQGTKAMQDASGKPATQITLDK